jgi:hypothetical protein
MKTTLSLSDFQNAFANSSRKDQFTNAWLESIFNYLSEYEESTGSEIELDIVSICCDFTEYENLEAFHKEHDKEEYPDFDSIEYEGVVLYTWSYQDEEAPFVVSNF